MEVWQGAALESPPGLKAEGRGPFDLTFIDVEKENKPTYFDRALHLSRRGSLIVVDSVVREGKVQDGDPKDPDVRGTREVLRGMGTDVRVSATTLQTVGSKGYDGSTVAWTVNDPGASVTLE